MKELKIKSNQLIVGDLQPDEEVASKVANLPPSDATSTIAILDRMKLATNTRSDTAFAKSLGMYQSAVSSAKERQSIPPAWAVQISEAYDVSLDWIMFGIGEMKRGAAPQPTPAPGPIIYNDMEAPEGACPDCELIMVPLVEARLSAGTGSLETSAESQKSYAFRSDWLRRKGNPKTMKLMRVTGDSMADEIKDNDHVLVDESQRHPMPGRIYAVSVHGMVYLKQIEAGQDGLLLISKNKDYPPMTLDTRGDLHDGIWIVGKAIWFARELD